VLSSIWAVTNATIWPAILSPIRYDPHEVSPGEDSQILGNQKVALQNSGMVVDQIDENDQASAGSGRECGG